MVASKRCKICAVIDNNNVSILGEYFGKSIPEVIVKICGIELDPRKAKDGLICQLCFFQLIQVEMVIEKFGTTLQRLKKNPNLKTPSKPPSKKVVDVNKTAFENGSEKSKDDLQSCEKAGDQSEKDAKTKTDKKLKSVSPDDKTKFKKFTDNSAPIKETPAIELKPKVLTSEIPNNHPLDNSDGDPPLAKRNQKSASAEHFPKDIAIYPDDNEKFTDNSTPVNVLKRKPRVLASEMPTNFSLSNSGGDPVLVKRKKISESTEELPLDLNQSKINSVFKECKDKLRNCIICGKLFQKGNLRMHIEEEHFDEPLRACVHCSSQFYSQQKYESHVSNEKCRNDIYTCRYPNCNKRFKTVNKMESHVQKRHVSQLEI